MTEAFSPTLASADFAAALQYDAIPTPVVDRIKRDLLDWIGCSIAGSIDPASKPIRAIDALMGGPKQAGVFGAPKMTDMRSAAMMNAYYSHIMEMDDVDRASISHPASCIFPAVLALAGETAKSASGKEMLASVVAGFEVMLRIGAAVTPAHYKVFHTTATTGVFGGAAASARLLGLNAEACRRGVHLFQLLAERSRTAVERVAVVVHRLLHFNHNLPQRGYDCAHLAAVGLVKFLGALLQQPFGRRVQLFLHKPQALGELPVEQRRTFLLVALVLQVRLLKPLGKLPFSVVKQALMLLLSFGKPGLEQFNLTLLRRIFVRQGRYPSVKQPGFPLVDNQHHDNGGKSPCHKKQK